MPDQPPVPGEAGGRRDLEQLIAGEIAADGPMGIDRYMQLALHHPTLGYYARPDTLPVGAGGDFVTAPEISQMFGELVGVWLAQRWQDMGAPPLVRLVELGPGRGTLMADVLRVIARVPGLPEAARVHLVERHPRLRQLQHERLGHARPSWHDDLDEVPVGPCLIVANEFLDCLPVRQFVQTPDGWREKQVGLGADGQLAFGLGPVQALAAPDAPPGTVREVMPGLAPWVAGLARRLQADPGSALLIDYGSDDTSPGDTLQAIWQHTKVSPLSCPGKADLTAHVDLARCAALARQAGLAVDGPAGQGAWLTALGIEARAASLIRANPDCGKAVTSAVERLVDPCHMGSLFKALALSSPRLPPAYGFQAPPCQAK